MLMLLRFLPFGRTLRKTRNLVFIGVAGLLYAGQTGPALDLLALTGIDLRGVLTTTTGATAAENPSPARSAPAPVARVESAPAATSTAPRPVQRPAPAPAAIPQSQASYDREDYGSWVDEDGNCRDTRAEVLIASSTGRVHMRKNGCSVDRGKWFDPYTGKTFTQASDVDIDHLVPLAWADAHGAAAWSPERKRAFANWQANLFPVQASVNREKGAKGPIHWLPPRVEYRCEYMLRFERVMVTWGLHYYRAEANAMRELKAHYCPAK